MTKFILRRLAYTVVVVVIATLFVFVLSRQSGDPRHLFLSEMTTQKQWEDWGREMGLDRPVIVQYWLWIAKAARGDFGESVQQRRPALDVVVERAPATLELAVLGVPMVVAYRVHPSTYAIGKALVRGIEHIALPNILAGQKIVPEHIQRLDPAALARDLLAVADDQGLVRRLDRVRARLGGPGAAARAAAAALEPVAGGR